MFSKQNKYYKSNKCYAIPLFVKHYVGNKTKLLIQDFRKAVKMSHKEGVLHGGFANKTNIKLAEKYYDVSKDYILNYYVAKDLFNVYKYCKRDGHL